MNKLFIFLIIPMFSATAQTYPTTNGQWILDLSRSDEFSNGFDTQKWEKNGLWTTCSYETVAKDENISVSGGKAKITARKETFMAPPYPICYSYNSTHLYNYTAGAFQSKFFVGNNTFIEVRARTMNYMSDMTSAIWLQEEPVFKRNPNIEIDMMETLESYVKPKMFSSSVHLWKRDENDESDYHMVFFTETYTNNILSESFHLYGLERNGESLRFYFDGDLIWEKNIMDDSSYPTNGIFPIEYRPYLTGQDRRLILSVGGHTPEGQAHPIDNFPQNFEIDYVRVYKKKYCPSNINFVKPLHEVDDYQANNTIMSESNINPNLIVNFKANKVILKPGFHVTGNSTGRFRASVEPCILSSSKSEKLNDGESSQNNFSYLPIISPNPATEVVYVSNIERVNEWKLLDINSNTVDSGKADRSVQNKITINLKSLKPGVYYFNAVMENSELFQKAIIKK